MKTDIDIDELAIVYPIQMGEDWQEPERPFIIRGITEEAAIAAVKARGYRLIDDMPCGIYENSLQLLLKDHPDTSAIDATLNDLHTLIFHSPHFEVPITVCCVPVYPEIL